jgi:hypothetical protein
MSARPPFGVLVERLVGVPRVEVSIRALASRCDPQAVAVDLGCGAWSSVGELVQPLTTVGIDTDETALHAAESAGTHDILLRADLLRDFDRIRAALRGRDVQLVTMLHVIEHVPRRLGDELLERAEQLTSRFVVVETPNGFQPQGPEYGNPAQRHVSGWFAHDFIGRGYDVHGTAGTKYLRGYAGQPKVRRRGGQSLDFVASRLLWIERFPRHAYNLTAIKDVRGVEARLD